jgi:hypothetical protein
MMQANSVPLPSASVGDAATDAVIRGWDGAAYRACRDRLDAGDPPDVCRSCAVYTRTR